MPDLSRRALRLEYATIGWNLFEVAFAVAAGLAARSLAQVGWWADALAAGLVGFVAVWQGVRRWRGAA